jgi:hypothetical protein
MMNLHDRESGARDPGTRNPGVYRWRRETG